MKPSANKRLFGWQLTAALLAVAAAYYAFYLRPQMAELRTRRDRADQLEQQQATLVLLPGQVRQVTDDLQDARRFVRGWRRNSRAADLPLWFGRISQVLDEAGVRAVQFKPDPAVEYATLQRIPLTLVCEGRLPDLLQAMAGIEALPPVVWVEDLKLSLRRGGMYGATPDGDRQDVSILQCELKLAIFADKSNFSEQAENSGVR